MKNKFCIDCNKRLNKTAYYKNTIRCRSCEAKRKHQEGILNSKGKNHPMYGKINYATLGDKNPNWNNGITKEKCYCVDCGRELGEKAIFKHTKRCPNCNFKFRVGKNAPNYIDGKGKEPYTIEFTEELKEQIRKRDNYKCQNCGMTEEEHLIVYGRKCHIHHIDYNKENCDKTNLITLCQGCNIRANYNRKYWKKYYQAKLNDKKNI
jgi:DNA-directed RNA polymerase subunit RPC12/RpoP